MYLFSFIISFIFLKETSAQMPTFYQSLFEDEFYADTLNSNWQTKAKDPNSSLNLTSQNGCIYLYCNSNSVDLNVNFNLLYTPITNNYFQVTTSTNFKPKINGEESGVCLYINNENYVLFDLKKEDNLNVLIIKTKSHKKAAIIQKDLVLDNYKNHIEFEIKCIDNILHFSYRLKSNDLWKNIDKYPSNKLLQANNQLYVGLYASSNGQKSKNYAAYDLFRYYELKK